MSRPSLSSPPRAAVRRSRLVNYLTLAYLLLIGYASLYPFRGWTLPASSVLAFVLAPWPRYYTLADLFLNVLAYAPLGFLAALALVPYLSARTAAALAILFGVALSLCMEVCQGLLPERVPSNLDLLSNGLGALAGAALAVTGGQRWLLSGRLHALRRQMFRPGAFVDLGFLLMVLWLFTQLNPEVWLFGNGDLRWLLRSPPNLAFDPESYRWIEAGVTAFNLAAVCLFAASLARRGRNLAAPLFALVATALLIKSAAALTLFKTGDAALWLTPGAMLGIPLGLVLYLALAGAPRRAMELGALALLTAGVALLNAAPENPYILASVGVWRYGHFLSFNGLTELVSTAWPFLAGAYLLWSLAELHGTATGEAP